MPRTLLATVGVFILVLVGLAAASEAAYEGLQNGGLEGQPGAANGFALGITPGPDDPTTTVAQQVEVVAGACDPAPSPIGQCIVNVGVPGPTTRWSAVQSVILYPHALGGKISDMLSFSGWQNVPNGPLAQEAAQYQFYYRIDVNEDSVPDLCIVQTAGFPQIPIDGASTAGWQPIVFSSTDPAIKFRDADAQCGTCPPPCVDMSQGEVQTKYPTARIMALYIQVLHRDWEGQAAANDFPVNEYPDWPAGVPIYLDAFSLQMQNSAGVLLVSAAGLEATEGGPDDAYAIRLSDAPTNGEVVTISIAEDPGAGASNQLTVNPTQITFTSTNWDTPQPISVVAIDDFVSEVDPKMTSLRHTVASSVPTSPYATMTVPSAPVTVHDNDLVGANPVPATIQLSEAAPATPATFNVQLGSAPAPGETVTVTLTPDARTTLDVGTVTFTTTDPLSKPVVVTVVDDLTDQPNLAPAALVTGVVSSNVPGSVYDGWPFPDVEVAIADNDPLVSIAAGLDGNEAGSVAGTFILTRGPDVSSEVTVAYTVSPLGTATSGADFTALPGTIVIPAGSASATLSVPVLGDLVDEPSESLVVTLTPTTVPYTTATGAAATASITILDDDDPAVAIAATTPNASEAGPAVGVLTITRSNGDLAIDVAYTVAGTASASDRSLDLVSPVHFDAGQLSRVLTVTPIDDLIDEAAETVLVSLAGGAGYQLGATSSDTVTIADDDVPVVSVAVTTHADEDGPVSGTFTLTRSAGDTTQGLLVSILVGGTAIAGTDYTAPASGLTSLPILPGDTTATFTVAPIQDTLVESVEMVVLQIGPGTDTTYTVASPPGDQASMDLKDNDYEVSIAASIPSANEGGTAQFTLTRDKDGPAFAVQLQYAGTATAGVDYTTLPATVSFAAGQLTATLDVATLTDGTDEPSETVTATLITAAPYAISGPSSAEATINDTNPPVAAADSVVAYRTCAASFQAPGLLSNDPVPAGLSYTAVAGTFATSQGGSVTVQSTGAFTYTPPPGFLGTDWFTYRVTDGVLQSSPATVQVLVSANAPPSLAITALPSRAIVGGAVSFVGLGADAEGPITGWDWTFGDGAGATQPSVTHSFGRPGRYAVTLQITDGQCGTAQAKLYIDVEAAPRTAASAAPAEKPVEVAPPPAVPPVGPPAPPQPPPAPPSDPPANSPPRAVATAPISVKAGAPIRLDATSSTDADGDALSFTWTQVTGRATELRTAKDGVATTAAPEAAGVVSYLVAVSDGTSTDTTVVEVFVEVPAAVAPPPPPTPDPWGDGASRGSTSVTGAGGDGAHALAVLVAWVAAAACLAGFVVVGLRMRGKRS